MKMRKDFSSLIRIKANTSHLLVRAIGKYMLEKGERATPDDIINYLCRNYLGLEKEEEKRQYR